jgi:hypothetical protein
MMSCSEFLDSLPIDFKPESHHLGQVHYAIVNLGPTAVNHVVDRVTGRTAVRLSDERGVIVRQRNGGRRGQALEVGGLQIPMQRLFQPECIVWRVCGSDGSAFGVDPTRKALADARIGEEAREQILHWNAAAMLARFARGAEEARAEINYR